MYPFLIMLSVAIGLAVTRRLIISRGGASHTERDFSHLRDSTLSQQPERIQLTPCRPEAWKNTAAARRLAEPLLFKGFADAGAHEISEMPGIVVRLLVKSDDAIFAAIYEHPNAGSWVDLVTHYEDGSKFTYSTLDDPGIETRPQHTIARAPSVDSRTLYSMALASRRKRSMRPITVQSVVGVFEQDYADWMAWRKARSFLEGGEAKPGRKAA